MKSAVPSPEIRPVVRTRIPNAPINRTMLAGTALAALSVALWPNSGASAPSFAGSAVSGVFASICVKHGITMLVRDYRLRLGVALSRVLSRDHGSARQSTWKERAARGMNSHRHGQLFGLDDAGKGVWRPENAFLTLTEMPPGVGKTSTLVMSSILHYARIGRSVVVPDVKAELAVMLAPHLRRLGYEVWCLNAAGENVAITGNVEVGLYQAFIDALYGDETERKRAIKIAADLAALHHPMTNEEKNPYFGLGSRRVIVVAIVLCGFLDPANCTPTRIYELLTDPALLLRICRKIQSFESVIKNDRVLDVLKREARNLLHRADKNEENFASFLEGASQKFMSFNPSGMLGNYGAGAIHSLSAIRERQVIVFIITPLSSMREFSDYITLINHGIVAAVKSKPDGHPIHIVGEEALNYRFHDLVSDLETLRQLGVTIDLYIQSFAGLEIHYGKQAAAAIESYADIRIYAGLNNQDRAKRVSEMLSETTIRRQEVSYQETVKHLAISSRELGRPLMKTNEVMAMPKRQAWMFVNGLHPVRLTMLSYAQVSPWRNEVDPSPITGTLLKAPAVLRVNYDAGDHHGH